MSILEEIVKHKHLELAKATRERPLSEFQDKVALMPPCLGFVSALRTADSVAIIAEVKKASPSKGVIREDFVPTEIAKSYSQNGACCLSILTEEKYFQGSLASLKKIRTELPLTPILRKDFIVDPYQVWETRAAGADAVLLIAAALSTRELQALYREALKAELDILLEVHNEQELEQAFEMLLQAERLSDIHQTAIGINNRDLNTFTCDLSVTEKLITRIPPEIKDEVVIVSESGISSSADILRLSAAGVKAFLIGEHLLASGDPGDNLAQLIEESTQ